MKAFVMGLAAMVVITGVAVVGLGAIDMSSGHVYSSKTGDVRL